MSDSTPITTSSQEQTYLREFGIHLLARLMSSSTSKTSTQKLLTENDATQCYYWRSPVTKKHELQYEKIDNDAKKSECNDSNIMIRFVDVSFDIDVLSNNMATAGCGVGVTFGACLSFSCNTNASNNNASSINRYVQAPSALTWSQLEQHAQEIGLDLDETSAESFAHIMGDVLLLDINNGIYADSDPRFVVIKKSKCFNRGSSSTSTSTSSAIHDVTSILLCYKDWDAEGELFLYPVTKYGGNYIMCDDDDDDGGCIGNRAMDMLLRNLQQYDDAVGINACDESSSADEQRRWEAQRKKSQADIVATLHKQLATSSSLGRHPGACVEKNVERGAHYDNDGGDCQCQDTPHPPKKQKMEAAVNADTEVERQHEILDINSEKTVEESSGKVNLRLDQKETEPIVYNSCSANSDFPLSVSGAAAPPVRRGFRIRTRGKSRGIKKFGKLSER